MYFIIDATPNNIKMWRVIGGASNQKKAKEMKILYKKQSEYHFRKIIIVKRVV